MFYQKPATEFVEEFGPDLREYPTQSYQKSNFNSLLGAISQALRILKRGGLYLLAVPDKRFIFDHPRQNTPLCHVIEDYKDGGKGTSLDAYREVAHLVLGVPLSELDEHTQRISKAKMDIHVHCWSHDGFREMLNYCEKIMPVRLEAGVLSNNENIFALRKL